MSSGWSSRAALVAVGVLGLTQGVRAQPANLAGRLPPAVTAVDQTDQLRAEVKALREEVAELRSGVGALKGHVHAYVSHDYGFFGFPCSRVQEGATGLCYVMLNPRSAEQTTGKPR